MDDQSSRSFTAVNECCAKLDRGVREGAICKNAPSGTPARFQHRNRCTRVVKIACSGKPGCASADDEGCHDRHHYFGDCLVLHFSIVEVLRDVKRNRCPKQSLAAAYPRPYSLGDLPVKRVYI